MFLTALLFLFMAASSQASLPIVVSTWAHSTFPEAAKAATLSAWSTVSTGGAAVDAVANAGSTCERLQCDHTVGYGGSPDELGETTLDALIMDGRTRSSGAVGDLRRVKDAMAVARSVMDRTKHGILVGDSATKFALEMGFQESNLSTADSVKMWEDWQKNKCQPNYRKNVSPNPLTSCGPYKPTGQSVSNPDDQTRPELSPGSHDTLGIVVIDTNKDVAAGCSSNGAIHKVPGRVGDGAMVGAGAYADNDVGGAAETGDGDIMMRFLPTYQTVEYMSQGKDPETAASLAIRRILRFFPHFSGSIVAADTKGRYGAACAGWNGKFSYSVRLANGTEVETRTVECLKP